jgi:long-chain acyl-CoA synthetase
MQEPGFDHYARLEPDAPALVDPQDRFWSRGELYSQVNRLSRALRAAGLERGDVIALLSPNCAEFLIAALAATRTGLYFLPINWHLAEPEIAHVLDDSRAAALLFHQRCSRGALAALRACTRPPRLRISIGGVPDIVSLQDFLSSHSGAPPEDTQPGRVLIYTSATTGRPKAIHLPLPRDYEALERAIRFRVSVGIPLGEGQVNLCSSMLYHAAPLEGAMVAMHMGHKVVLVDRWDPEELLRLIERHKVTHGFMVPSMFVRMLKLPPDVRSRYCTSSLRLIVHSAAPCPVEIKRQMIEWWGPILIDSYGAAEGGGTFVTSQEWLRYPGTVGRAIPGSQIKILDDEGRELPPGQVGTIYMTRYSGDRFEYLRDPEKTRSCYRGDFFTAGDVGYLNDEGYLFLCDRKIDMIISGGMNIYPAEIERILVLHRHVADCAVFGVPDEILGEAVRAVVQLMPGCAPGHALAAELLQFMSGRLSPEKIPRRIEFAAELPRDPSGKLFKRKLRDPHWAGRQRAV